jgi:hypothetical protein
MTGSAVLESAVPLVKVSFSTLLGSALSAILSLEVAILSFFDFDFVLADIVSA